MCALDFVSYHRLMYPSAGNADNMVSSDSAYHLWYANVGNSRRDVPLGRLVMNKENYQNNFSFYSKLRNQHLFIILS